MNHATQQSFQNLYKEGYIIENKMIKKKINGIFDVAVNEELVKGKKIFVAHCLNLGIASQGYSYEEALENIEDAIKLYLKECPGKLPKEQEKLLPPIATRLFL